MLVKTWVTTWVEKRYVTDASKANSKRVIQKTAEATGDLIRNEITNSIQIHNKIIQRQLQMNMI